MTTKSLKDVFDEAENEIAEWPPWKKSLLERARSADAYFASSTPAESDVERLQDDIPDSDAAHS